ncbi:probable galacturonosyltransferase 6 isoform X2 [Spinacia oleracea]|uniref:Hexosyltransferase n=1 Tax=Spinacia oleracea TaxID=3562 RepID=A0A9R0I781_SPIOL|nr:probable galacturonosyltransferase 6 isoform X2 [Spinacia oleracea]
MKRFRRWQRIFILFLLSLSVFAPLVLVSIRLKTLTSEGKNKFVEDLPSIMQQYKSDVILLSAVGQGSRTSDVKVESGSERRGTQQLVGEEVKPIKPREELVTVKTKDHSDQISSQHDHGVRAPRLTVHHSNNSRNETRKATDEKVKQMKDQVVRARAYLSFATTAGNTHLVKELKLRIKEVERAMGEARKDSELSRGRLQKMKYMESTLSKASHVYPDCSNMVNKLRAMTHSAEEQVQSQRKQTTFLTELAGRTTPKGLHCLSMRLTTDYFMLQPEKQMLPNQQNVNNPDFHHYVTFSDNVLAAAVVVNSTVSNAMEPERVVFHVVTDSLNFPTISMWFLLNPPGKATIQVLNMQDFQWWNMFESSQEKQSSSDPRYSSLLNHLRFYLPEIFPQLGKIVFLDHDVVVQKDLSGLLTIDMKGKVNGAVETCQEDKSSFRQMARFINFSDPLVARKFDANTCTWAFGMNLFDLRQWRHHDLTSSYRRFLLKGNGRPLWKAGSLPLGWITFYNRTLPLDQRWHLLGLGFDSVLRLEDIEQAAVIHYDGIMKPWLDIGIKKYKSYWNKYANYDHPYMQQCNLHG